MMMTVMRVEVLQILPQMMERLAHLAHDNTKVTERSPVNLPRPSQKADHGFDVME